MARVAPAPGTTVEEVVRTRTIPDAAQDKTDERDFWEFTAALTPKEWERYMVYVYRRVGDRLGPYVAKYPGRISEDMIAENHGGGCYRCWLKTTAGEIIKTANFEIEGAPKINTGTPVTSPSVSPASPDQNSINRLCDLVERVLLRDNAGVVQNDAMRGALSLQAEGFRSVVSNIRETVTPPAPQPAAANPMDEMTRQFMQAAIQKMLNPSDPIETFAKMMAAMKGLGFGGGDAKASIGAEIVRTLGGALPQIVDGVKSYTNAVTKQAELEIIRITHGVPRPGQQPPPAAPQPPAPLHAQPAPAAAPPPQPAERQPLTFEQVEARIATFMMDANASARDAANNILDFIEDISPDRLYPYICALDEPNLTAFIDGRPGLASVPRNPRFTEIIKQIIELAHSKPPDNPESTPAQTPA